MAGSLAAAVPDNVVRPDFQNAHASGGADGGVILFNATIAHGLNQVPPSSPLNILPESSFGLPFSTYLTPYSSFSDDVLFHGRTLADGTFVPGVYTKLYPAGYLTDGGVTQNASQIAGANQANNRIAFRYKWLMYGEEPESDDPNPPILNIFEQSATSSGWFTDDDRALARSQIAVLREALAYAPLDRGLQAALLDIYYDWAVAEMQFARRQLVDLSTVRLGLVPVPKFVIDEEIESYKVLVEISRTVLNLYGELFSTTLEGVNPSDFYADTIDETGQDPSGGAPFGYFIFQQEVPKRNQVPTQYATDSGVQNVLDPGESNTFSGFKDYRSLLTILGQHIQYQADLADLRGRRQADSPDGADITVARQGLTEAQAHANTAVLLAHLFRRFDFDDNAFNETGVRGAKTLVRTALNDALGVRSFLDGTANALRLDPNFLLLVPPDVGSELFDSYDILRRRLNERDGTFAVGPLAKALDALGDPENPTTGGGAIQAYGNFRASVGQVQNELNNLESEFAARFVAITGYRYDTERDLWNGVQPKAGAGSELETVERAIQSYITRNERLSELTFLLLDEISKADEAVSIASSIGDRIIGAQSQYESETASAWTEIHVWAGLAAGTQAATETAYELAGVDGAGTLFSGGGNIAAITIAGAINTGIQASAAARTSERTQEIDKAAIAFDTNLALAELPLTVKQAQLELGSLLREAFANRLEIEDNFTALAQALADKMALLNEVQRAQENLKADRAQLAGQFYADPIHFIRSERAILQADAAFRRAQRWVFFTARALEYKWSERFSEADPLIGESYDIGSIIKARNAFELETIVQKMSDWDGDRTGTAVYNTTIISMRDQFLTPNPDDVNRTFSTELVDSELRYDPATRTVVDRATRFRQLLNAYRVAGNLVIPFDTTVLQNFGTFFPGPDFSEPANPDSRFYRNKIEWVAVNIVAKNGVTPPDINGRTGRLTYGGNTFFRTRVPVRPNRTTAPTLTGTEAFNADLDFPGEFIVSPFRFYQDTNFTGVFEVFDVQNVTGMKFAYSKDSANNETVLTRLTAGGFGFMRQELKERSVAATRWQLRIDSGQYTIDQIEDIELVIRHVSYARPQIRGQ